ncbi:glycine cleavage system aminomethyltransferase GcvT [Sphingomonas sp. AP4-R1]|uniref:glycine cleavage system aminomethyltransferase GcvT n=1 Tax=Sphingomonas sp. AP4-R1 TaxID=2735134 RepID=UPI0014934BCF|nr:glycine cleavage system aminomethyltransferase GcvT [Sphingomonas sp. AP4-R1]QJU59502.1 glycine cleavage system aminomethyltransferase GcvT [Sphingomonas sp. AP4-R1]
MSDEDVPEIIEALPLDSWHRTLGGRMVPFAGYHMPIQYDGIMAEHLWTRENAGLFDVSHMGQLTLSGADADAALETILPGDIKGLGEGKMRYSLLLAQDGGILDDLMVTRLPAANPFEEEAGDFYVVVNGATKWDDIGYLHEQLPEGLNLNHRGDQALLALQGPKAVDALARLAPGVAELSFMEAGAFTIAGVSAWVSRSGYTGEDGFEISIPQDSAEAVAEALLAMPEVKPIGLGARDSLRLEAGLPLYGHDLNETIDPATAALGFAVPKRRRAEGGFPGAERTIGYFKDGPPTKRVGLTVEGRQPVREGATIYDGDQAIGTITSGGHAPSLQAPIAMGYVNTDRSALGTALEIEVRGKRIAATVTAMPFVPQRYFRKGAK